MKRARKGGGGGCWLEGGIKEIFSLMRNLQDADGQGTVSDGG